MRALRLLLVSLPAAVGDLLVKLRVLTEPIALAALLLLGVHSAADLLDNLLFGAVDAVDRVADGLSNAALSWLGEAGVLEPATAAAWSDSLALLLDIDGKEALAVWLSLGAELLIGGALLWWSLPVRESAAPMTAGGQLSGGAGSTARARVAAGLRRAPDLLRATSLILAFTLGALALGRWAAGYVALGVARPVFGPNAGVLAVIGGVTAAAIALAALLPVALDRVQARAKVRLRRGSVRATAVPLLIALLFLGAVVTGEPGRALARLLGGGA